MVTIRAGAQGLSAGVRVVQPRVAGIRGEVLHRHGPRGAVYIGDRRDHHIIGSEDPDERDALGAQNVRSNPCTPRSPNAFPCAPLGVNPSSSQRATAASAGPPARWTSVRPTIVATV
jgi:hypothetical protein